MHATLFRYLLMKDLKIHIFFYFTVMHFLVLIYQIKVYVKKFKVGERNVTK